MLVLNLPFKALMFLTLMRPSLVLFLVLWLKLVKDFLKVRCRLALLPFLISCLIWLDLVASLPLINFFFQAEDGIRDKLVTGVQTCALPISPRFPTATATSSADRSRSASRSTPTRCSPTASRCRFSAIASLPVVTSGKRWPSRTDQIGRASCRERVYLAEGAE